MSGPSFAAFFERVTGRSPHQWQAVLGDELNPTDRLIRIPTGFGKTAGVVLPWVFHRIVRGDAQWPRRLVLTLPMRVLVEQTERAVREWLERAAVDASVHVLMGGSDAGAWHLDVEKPAVLIATQDMVLSRALNRGFGAARGRWPVDFGLLHHDALWVFDEIQLMDVGLVTSVQLGQFRRDSSATALRPTYSWWMSATLQPTWVRTRDAAAYAETLARSMLTIPAEQRGGGLWEVQKPLIRRHDATAPDEVAKVALDAHRAGTLTLVVVNRVSRALEVYGAIEAGLREGKGAKARRRSDAPEVQLVHSRYRGAERESWSGFLARDAHIPEHGRIVVATQVVEAGVDISATTLVTDLAPWPSLVQRFGRSARYEGERGQVIVVGAAPRDDKAAAPYDAASIAAASELLDSNDVRDVGPRALELLEEALDPNALTALYPYMPMHVIRRPDLDELFDTAPDLSGADLDVSRYIRSGEERDAALFWRDVERLPNGRPPAELPTRTVPGPTRDELCRAPLSEARGWLKGRVAYIRDYRAGAWVRLSNDELARRVHAGATVLVDAAEGGYDASRGWDPKSKAPVPVIPPTSREARDEQTSAGEDEDALSELSWQTIGDHGRETGAEARTLATALGLPPRLGQLLELAGLWHDVGKAHPVFQAAIRAEAREAHGGVALGGDLAKAPDHAWNRPAYRERPGFRHELASTIALLEVVRRANSHHSGLLGPHADLLAALGEEPSPIDEPIAPTDPLVRELCALSATELDLLAYLVCAHHGKVRCSWTSTAKDQKRAEGAIHGVCEGDVLPATSLGDHVIPELRLSLAPAALGVNALFGASWAERVAGLLREYGPFALAYLEAVLRAADVRVSRALENKQGGAA